MIIIICLNSSSNMQFLLNINMGSEQGCSPRDRDLGLETAFYVLCLGLVSSGLGLDTLGLGLEGLVTNIFRDLIKFIYPAFL